MSVLDVPNRMYKLLLTLGVVLALFWLFRIYEIWNNVTGNYVREITVEAEGTAYVVPDTAVIRIGVSTEGEDSASVVNENTEKMNAVLAAIEALGVEDSDVQTVDYYLSPSYEYDDSGNYVETGYSLDQTVEVRLSDFELIGQLISDSSKAGANYVGGVEFTVDDPEMAKAEARVEAITRAKEKAEQIAEASGLRLGDLVSYWEYAYEGYGKGGYYEDYYLEGESLSIPEIEAGEQEITLTVSLSYQIH